MPELAIAPVAGLGLAIAPVAAGLELRIALVVAGLEVPIALAAAGLELLIVPVAEERALPIVPVAAAVGTASVGAIYRRILVSVRRAAARSAALRVE